jgi:hypothetical protein
MCKVLLNHGTYPNEPAFGVIFGNLYITPSKPDLKLDKLLYLLLETTRGSDMRAIGLLYNLRV